MKQMTKANIEAAFAGESQAHMKYNVYADKAERDGFPQVAKLFRAIAFAERVHATNHLRVLEKVKETAANLVDAAGGEHYEVEEMYPAFEAVAERQQDKNALRSIRYAVAAEKIHVTMYTEAQKNVVQGKDIPSAAVYVCPVCGHTVIGEAPDKCPVCGLAKEKYQQF